MYVPQLTLGSAGLRRLEYTLAVAAGPSTPPDDYGVIAVIDGSMYDAPFRSTVLTSAQGRSS